jgi:hypothetical protein
MFRKKTRLVFLALALTACGVEGEQHDKKEVASPVEAARESVEQLHDSIMMRMGEIHRLQEQLAYLRDSLSVDSSPVASQLKMLDEAEEAMMRWMREYKKPEDATKEELLRFFEQEKEKIEQVGKQMAEAIDKSRAFVDSVQQSKQK